MDIVKLLYDRNDEQFCEFKIRELEYIIFCSQLKLFEAKYDVPEALYYYGIYMNKQK